MCSIPLRSPARKLGLGDIVETGSGLPSRIVVYGPEGSGKTSLGAPAPKPFFLMSRGETGLLTLLDFGLVRADAALPRDL